jgi:hypothetical protein
MKPLPATAYIIRDGAKYLCPVCGWPETFRGDHFDDEEGGCIAMGICDCCVYEPGFDDNPLASAAAKATIGESILAFRGAWLAEGAPWRGNGSRRAPPDGWSSERQLARLYELAPFLQS